MATAGDVIKDALQEITVLGAEAPVEASDATYSVRTLNRMMAMLDAKGIDLGFTEVSNFNSELTIPDGALDSVVILLSNRLWRNYSEGNPPQSLMMDVRAAISQLAQLAVTIAQSEYPSTLPIGSGNQESGYRTDLFYNDLEDTILAETNGSISLEDGT